LFERGFRRNREKPLAIEGDALPDPEGTAARFSLALAGGKIVRVGFQVSTCATLIAFCELLAEIAAGLTLAEAWRLAAPDLVVRLADVPPQKRHRAILAIAAFRAALLAARAGEGGSDATIQDNKEQTT